ncbi:hypothetical protein ACFY4H_25660 [Streptomyces althioticus]
MLVALFVGKRNSRPWIVSDELWSLNQMLLNKLRSKISWTGPGR